MSEVSGCFGCACGARLSTRTEVLYTICTDCLSKIVKEYPEKTKAIEEMNQKFQGLQDQLTKVEEMNDKWLRLMEAEKQGFSAAERELDENENPYPADVPEHEMWNHGLFQGSVKKEVAVLETLIRWAGYTLEAVDELARGYGQTEISAKIQTVIQKLADNVTPEETPAS